MNALDTAVQERLRAAALAITAVANTAANRRLTFGIHGREHLLRHHWRGAAVFVLALALSNGALLVLHGIDATPPRALELTVLVLGSIYSGYATPSEAAAVGVAATLVLIAATGQLSWRIVAHSLMGAIRISAMVCSILVAAAFLQLAEIRRRRGDLRAGLGDRPQDLRVRGVGHVDDGEPGEAARRMEARARAERQKKLREIRKQVKDGTLVIRKMTPAERKKFPPRTPDAKSRRSRRG